MDLNRRLRVRHEQMYKEYASLATIVKRLEEENRDYVQRNVGVEWNLLISGRGGVNGEDDSDDDGNDDNTDNVSESSVSENSDGLDGDEKQDSILSMKWMDESVISDSESSPSSINKEINFSDTASSNAVNNSSIGGVNKLASDQGTKTKKKTNPISSRTNKTSHHKANTPLKWLQKSHAPGFEHESVSYSQSPIVVSNNTTLSNNTASVSHQRKQSTLLSSHHAKTTTSSAHASPLSLRSASPLLSNVKTPELDSIKLAQLDKIFPGMYRYNLFEKCTAPSATTAFAQNIIKPSVITNSADQAFAVAAQVIEEHKEQQQRQPVSTHIDEQQLVRTNKVLLEAQRAVDELMTYEIVMRHKRIDDSTSLAVRGNQQRIRGIDPKTSGAVRYMGPLTASV